MQFFMILHRFSFVWGLGVMVERRFSRVGFQSSKNDLSGPPGSWRNKDGIKITAPHGNIQLGKRKSLLVADTAMCVTQCDVFLEVGINLLTLSSHG